ncbi:MAG: TetR/AcrR family transcriptional regulator [Weeksellaceae bacterium]|nr:TetR/AcrR family transcriptional regulator [Weeksellaceae bacterium]
MNRSEFVEAVTPLFLKHGYRSLNIDQISKELNLSKKTIYTLFPGKKSIISSVLNQRDRILLETASNVLQNSSNAIEAYVNTIIKIGEMVNFNQQLTNLQELDKYYSELYEENSIQLKEVIKKIMKDILQRGEQEELFDLIDIDVTCNLASIQYLQLIMPQTILPEFQNNRQLHWRTVVIHTSLFLRSLLNPKGYEILKSMQSNMQVNDNHSHLPNYQEFQSLDEKLWKRDV